MAEPTDPPDDGSSDNNRQSPVHNEKGRFVKGNPGGTYRVRTGGRSKQLRLIDDLMNEGRSQIAKNVLEGAKANDPVHLRLYHEYYWPKLNLNPTPVDVDQPQNIDEAKALSTELLVKSLAGELDQDAAAAATEKLKTFAAMNIGADLAKRLDTAQQLVKQLQALGIIPKDGG
jgi:hypothetical protein